MTSCMNPYIFHYFTQDNYVVECNVKNDKDELFLCAQGPVKMRDPDLRMGRSRQAAKPDHDKLDPRRSEDKQPHTMSQL